MSSSTKDVNETRLRITAAIATGKLPKHAPERSWGGRGSGLACAICQEPVSPEGVEWELEFTAGSDAAVRSLRFHPDCFEDWDLARRELQRALPVADSDVSLGHREREALTDGK